jgi:transcriptional regulator with XRE-family HTH domain
MTKETNIGSKIAQLRQLKNLSASKLATIAGLSEKQLESIESGKIIPSLGILIKITRALGLRLGTLLDDNNHPGPSITKASDAQKTASFSTQEEITREHLTFFSLAPNKAGKHMEPFLIDIRPGESSSLKKSSHEGEEFIYVMEGKVTIAYGTEVFELEKNDSIYLDSIVDHLVTAKGKETAKILAVVYVPV